MVHGLLLAAGAGRRMGMPKALVSDEAGPWLTRSVRVLLDGGCPEVTVVLGAGADEAAPLLDGLPGVTVVRSADWSSGMGASLATGLEALGADHDPDAVLVHLVDLPDVTAAVVARVLGAAGDGAAVLARASYDGVPGHPVLLGRDHWPGVVDSAAGDRGARAYLAAHEVALVECGDLAAGADVDRR
ncbi:nucleotidyltransferase family protein [Nocardioides sp. LHD-245]|uniref:nucleotidyltransferase family protein n=1 Tax=Nocardioides sp. LHD-245 TaxID=3051387 RepID=UPI0027E1E5AE|nr:nucleotidyltransferase family protein [Nocardioides sp. LHD-245]